MQSSTSSVPTLTRCERSGEAVAGPFTWITPVHSHSNEGIVTDVFSTVDYPFGNITGPAEVILDYAEQTYTVSMACPTSLFCMWTLNNSSPALTSNSSIKLRFRPDQIGTHTLSYVTIVNGMARPLASMSVSVKPIAPTGKRSYFVQKQNMITAEQKTDLRPRSTSH